ncbi:MAG: aspartate kinase [Actinobacteria bacterium]|nr:aspartate kinase [Actinomycetota bacterium]
MPLIVQKYGGTSVGDAERIKRVAERVVATQAAGNKVCVVVSAMGHTTDELVELAGQISPVPASREMDMLLTAGERISMALLSMAINELGSQAISFTGSQAGIVTDTSHGQAKIIEVKADRVRKALAENFIAIVAGFQGVSTSFDVTTLGRGGSDASAVAIAAALEADACEIWTDVEGVFTADPRVVPEARKLHAVSYEEMLELAAGGAGVLMLRSVEYARNYGVKLHVRSTFTGAEGTWITEEDERMEQAIISGIAHDISEAKVTVKGVPDHPGVASRVFRPLADGGVNIDMIVQNVSDDGKTDISFTLPKSDLPRALPVLEQVKENIGAEEIRTDDDIAKVSLVGAGMKSHPGVAADMFDALADANINIEIISTSSIRVSCVVRAFEVERAVQVIHDKFQLSTEVIFRETHAERTSPKLKVVRAEDDR